MVQDYTAPIKEYDYDFEYVMEAYERRFGENGCPDIPIIKKLGNPREIYLNQEKRNEFLWELFNPGFKDITENNIYDNGHTIVRRCM